MTTGQARAFEVLGPRFILPYRPALLDLDAAFGRHAPTILEIGFGMGEATAHIAGLMPHADFLCCEVHEPGVGHLLLLLERSALTNVRVIVRDATDVLPELIPDASFAAVDLLFPDPWPKKRHHKRRIVQPGFVAEVARVLVPGGLFHVATDWADYAQHTREVLAASERFEPVSAEELRGETLALRPPTKFERRGRRLGHEVVDLYYRARE